MPRSPRRRRDRPAGPDRRQAARAVAWAVAAAALAGAYGAATAAHASRAHVDAPAVVQTSVTLFPVADAFVDQQNPTQNFNNAAQWPVERRMNDTERYPLLKFDTSEIPEDATVTSADLKVFLLSGSGDSPVVIKVERITFDWNQGTVTWNSRPPVAGVYGSWETDNDPGPRTFDVRVLVGNWVRKSMPNHGVTLRGPDGGRYERLYRSTGATRPHLDIVYTSNAPTATPTPTASATPSQTATSTATPTATITPSSTPTATPTSTPSSTPPPTPTSSFTPSATPTDPPTPTSTPTETTPPPGSATLTATTSPTPSVPPPTPVTPTAAITPTLTATPLPTAFTPGPPPTPTGSPTPTNAVGVGTMTSTPTATPTSPIAVSTPTMPGTPFTVVGRLYLPLNLRSATMDDPNAPTPPP